MFLLNKSSLQKTLIILIVFPKKSRSIQAIRAFFPALPAVEAFFHLLHLFLPFLAQIAFLRRAPQQQAHPRTIIDLDSYRARHAITAAPAEIPCQLFLLLLYFRLSLLRHFRRAILVRKELIQLCFPLDSPDRLHMPEPG